MWISIFQIARWNTTCTNCMQDNYLKEKSYYYFTWKISILLIILVLFLIMVFWHNAEQKIKFNKRTRSQHFSCNAIDLIHNIISCRSESEICYWRYLQYLYELMLSRYTKVRSLFVCSSFNLSSFLHYINATSRD